MNLAKLLSFRKTEEEEEQFVKVQKPKAAKKNALAAPAKTKKADSTKKTPKTPKKPDGPRFGWVQKSRDYLREVLYELRKVIWPSRKETLGSTAVVLVIVIICGIYLGILDLVLSRLIRMIIG